MASTAGKTVLGIAAGLIIGGGGATGVIYLHDTLTAVPVTQYEPEGNETEQTTEEEVKMLSDVYSLKETLIPHTMPIKSLSLMMKNEAKQRISQQMRLADGKERI